MSFHRSENWRAVGPSEEQVRNVVVVAHRGGRFDAPNTLIGIKKAINYAQLNPDIRFMIEVDVQQCRSATPGAAGQLVVIHDSIVNFTTTSKGKVSSFTFDQLQSLTIRHPRQLVPPDALGPSASGDTWLLPTPEEDRRIPSLQEVLDVLDIVNHCRYARGVPLIGIGIDFTHVANRMDRFKDHVLYPFLDKVNSGSQLHKVSAPEPLLNQLAQEISVRKGRTPIQIISQGVHGRRHLGMLLKLIEGSSVSFSIAVQASTSLFPADSTDVRAAVALDEGKLDQLVREGRFTINYNHRWDRLAYYLRRLTGFNFANPFYLVPDRFAISNREAMTHAQADGFRTGFWTVNSPDAIRDVILWGANMVTTDYPPRAVAFIKSQRREEVGSLSFATGGLAWGRQAPLGWTRPGNKQPDEEERALRRA
jgi:glycerophosphoryl diester phosphodiesterase